LYISFMVSEYSKKEWSHIAVVVVFWGNLGTIYQK